MSELITNPTFTFSQGDIFDGAEPPVQIIYWNGGDLIELQQEGRYILINTDMLFKLAKEVKKHLPNAKLKLNK